jgi:hypothetical protein
MTATATTNTAKDDTGEGSILVPAPEDTAAGIIRLRSATSPAEDERVPVFEIDGTVYTMAKRVKTNQGLQYTHLARTRGTEIAIDYAMEVTLGKEGYAALCDFDDLSEEDLEAIIKKATTTLTGAVEGPKARQKPGSRKSRGS